MAGRRVQTLVAHNTYLHVAAELGLVGLVLFVALLVRAAQTLVTVRRSVGGDTRLGAFAHVLLASLIGYAVCGFFQSAAYFPFFFLLLGLAAATGALLVTDRRPRGRGGLSGLTPVPAVPTEQPHAVRAPAAPTASMVSGRAPDVRPPASQTRRV
jgi:hypothetical protein